LTTAAFSGRISPVSDDRPDKSESPPSDSTDAGEAERRRAQPDDTARMVQPAKKRKRRRRRKKKQPRATPATPRKAPPRALGRGHSRRHLLFAAVGLLAVIATSAILLVFGFGRLHGTGTDAVEVDWPRDLDPEQAAALLAQAELVRSAPAMALYLRTSGGTSGFVPGTHLLYRGASPVELRAMLERSPSRPTVRVVIPEGFHRFDIADRLHKLHVAGKNAFLDATTDRALLVELGIETTASPAATAPANQERTTEPPESAEGFLFPATYDLQVDTDAGEIVRRLVAEADKRWAAIVAQHPQGLAAAAGSLGWGRREVVTLASIIQREAMMDDERPVIASVFYNRLLDPNFRPKRRLQSDPTAMYGCVAHPEEAPTCADYHGKPTSAVLHDPKNRYTTYMLPGLPPGPISNPGPASLEAALSPATTKFLFFVAKGGGRHAFSETFDAHNNAIQSTGRDSRPFPPPK
jgi:UPF0755 protein